MLAKKPFLYLSEDLILLIGVIKMLDKLRGSFNSVEISKILQNVFN
jgi:hypothetical protein